jgi:5-hydroxyisourate hydrolase
MTEISTHVLDISRGIPAAGVGVALFSAAGDGGWTPLGSATTDADGRAKGLASGGDPGDAGGVQPIRHRLVFACGDYQRLHGEQAFLEELAVSFAVGDQARLHMPLLLSPFGLSIYRGS